ncbi:uncharacterized protein LOC113279138 [Papaver somniferum]|uniref:uncharacterized protein LOC113279138 n=1 Tax=Papaver somniferum TaxID=3469 RepID=UPI000E6FAE31|nr:uncharacterized protein LOC113279138 [Papaver somniferum]
MSRHITQPWVIVGDLNVTLHSTEKQTFSTHTTPSRSSISRAIDQIGLIDIPFSGYPFTWCNNRTANIQVRVCLNRALANSSWFYKYKEALVYHLLPMGSDHSPILLHIDPSSPLLRRPFRCYKFWFKYPQWRDIIASSWKTDVKDSPAYQFVAQLKTAKQARQQWKTATFGNIQAFIDQLQAQLQETIDSNGDLHLIQALKDKLDDLYDSYNNMMFQQSRENILKYEDKKTKFFHSKANY